MFLLAPVRHRHDARAGDPGDSFGIDVVAVTKDLTPEGLVRTMDAAPFLAEVYVGSIDEAEHSTH